MKKIWSILLMMAMTILSTGCINVTENGLETDKKIIGSVEEIYGSFCVKSPEPVTQVVVSVFAGDSEIGGGLQNGRLFDTETGEQMAATIGVPGLTNAGAYFPFDLYTQWEGGCFNFEADAMSFVPSGTSIQTAILADYSDKPGIQPSVTTETASGPSMDVLGPVHELYDTVMRIDPDLSIHGGPTVPSYGMAIFGYRVTNSTIGLTDGSHQLFCMEIYHTCGENTPDNFSLYQAGNSQPLALRTGDGLLEQEEEVCLDLTESFPDGHLTSPGATSNYVVRANTTNCWTNDRYAVIPTRFVWSDGTSMVEEKENLPSPIIWDF